MSAPRPEAQWTGRRRTALIAAVVLPLLGMASLTTLVVVGAPDADEAALPAATPTTAETRITTTTAPQPPATTARPAPPPAPASTYVDRFDLGVGKCAKEESPVPDPKLRPFVERRLYGTACGPGTFKVLAHLRDDGSCDGVPGTTHSYVEIGEYARRGTFCLQQQ